MNAGRLRIVGLGPGSTDWMTPEAVREIAEASDIVGYAPYVGRLALRPDQVAHASDNRVELDRARLALQLAAEGRRVAVVSGGDPGIFAMAAAVMEAVEAGASVWRALDIAVCPGVSAMQAVAARLGAPLGGDFCAISLSDNLKPWALVERRLRAAAEGDFVLALYNPASKARPHQIHEAFALLRRLKDGATPVAFARAIGREDERIEIATLAEADPARADMSTLVLIGSSATRLVTRPHAPPLLLTPRSVATETEEPRHATLPDDAKSRRAPLLPLAGEGGPTKSGRMREMPDEEGRSSMPLSPAPLLAGTTAPSLSASARRNRATVIETPSASPSSDPASRGHLLPLAGEGARDGFAQDARTNPRQDGRS